MTITNGLKIFITGVTFALLAAVLALSQPFLIVGGIFAAIGCVLIWLNQ
jgi:hypothetical protein